MLHELLFALTGHIGDVFVLNETKDISISKNLPFIHTTEEATLIKLCYLANCYLKLKTFVNETNNYFNFSIGLYAKSFARGLELCMEPYQKLIIDLEKELLSDPYLSLAHVVAKLEEYQKVFPSLVKLSEEVAENRVHGCAILDMLYKESICGMPSIRKAILKILHICHSTMYKQLTSWILHGMLFDDNIASIDDDNKCKNEFFIKCVESVGTVDGDDTKKDVQSGNGSKDFDLDIEMLPDHISLKTAQKILFIGRSVVIFESSGKERQGSSIMKNKQEEFMAAIKKLSTSETFDVVCFEETIDGIRTYVAEQLWNLMVSQSDLQLQLRYFKDFFLIGRGELFLAFIDQSQDILRKPPMVMTQYDVNVAFQHAARNVLLDEEICQRFKFVIEVPDTKTATQTDANSNTTSVANATTNSSSLANTTTTTTTSRHHPSSFLNTRESGWNCLKMIASVEWPLHVMFTTNIVKKYSQLFSFLLYIKRIQLELQHCWSIEMNQRHLSSTRISAGHDRSMAGVKSSSSLNEKRRLRNHMAFLVDNLQYYLQVDVIESQYCLMLDKIKTKKDFEEIMLAHEFFLTSLHHQCFFHSKQISNCLTRILELCHAYYGLVVYSDSVLSTTQESQLQEIAKEFELQSNLLFRLLSSFRNNQSSNPHLAQLLLRIDYNKFFSSVQQL